MRLAGQERGYSMVEVLAAIVILSLAILPMVSMFDAGLRAAVLGGNYDKARAYANSNLEQAKSDGFYAVEELEDGECPPLEGGVPEGIDDCEMEKDHVDAEFEDVGSGEEPAGYELNVIIEWDDGDNEYTATGAVIRGSP